MGKSASPIPISMSALADALRAKANVGRCPNFWRYDHWSGEHCPECDLAAIREARGERILNTHFVQLKNPRSGLYVKVDRAVGTLDHKEKPGPFEGVLVIEPDDAAGSIA